MKSPTDLIDWVPGLDGIFGETRDYKFSISADLLSEATGKYELYVKRKKDGKEFIFETSSRLQAKALAERFILGGL